MEFSRLEKVVIEAILSQTVDGMEAVRKQFAAASVIKRDYSNVGFFTKISVPASVPPLPCSEELHDTLRDGATGWPKSDPAGVIMFMLWTEDGYLACLEGVTVRDSWPNEDDIESFCPVGHKGKSL